MTVKGDQLIRWCGLAAIAAGLLVIAARVAEVALFGAAPLSAQAMSARFVPLVGLPSFVGTVLFLPGAVGLHARQMHRAGRFGLLAFVVAFAGLSLTVGAHWLYAFGLPLLGEAIPHVLDLDFTDPAWGTLGTAYLVSYLWAMVGWVLLALASLRAGVLPRWVSIVWLGSFVLILLLPLTHFGYAGIFVNFLLAAGPISFGYALWAERDAAPA